MRWNGIDRLTIPHDPAYVALDFFPGKIEGEGEETDFASAVSPSWEPCHE